MAIPLVQVRHKQTGRKTFLPESALPHFPGYTRTPSQKSRDEVPDGTAFPTETPDGDQPSVTTKADATAPTATKGK